MPTRSSKSAARLRDWVVFMPSCNFSDSVICVPMVSTGFSEVIGSWKDHGDFFAADEPHLVGFECQQIAPFKHHCA